MTSGRITAEESARARMGPYSVTIVRNHRVTLSDGVYLAIKIWFPEDNCKKWFPASSPELWYNCEEGRKDPEYPTIIEYLPYRKSDCTALRDQIRHTWFCSHGYVCIRADLRGSGSSGGLYFDEYTPQEQKDACELIDWISQQQWSNGQVGMYGKSWGGFNGLQVAYEQPSALSAVIALYFTDDRYETDVHYEGGCVLANEMLVWSTRMFAWNCAPPDPSEVPDWRQAWQDRLEKASEPWVHTWLSHQLRDDYWKHGSICEDFSRVKCPVLAIGGWSDSYFDAVFRLLGGLPNAKAIVGPWSHAWPDETLPGPQMEYLGECLEWWDCHLKGTKPATMEVPRLRVYIKDSVAPSPREKHQLGHWTTLRDWPDDSVKNTQLIPDGMSECLLLEKELAHDVVEVAKLAHLSLECGMNAGVWCSPGQKDGPIDQRPEDAHSLGWTSKPLTSPLEILGFPILTCRVSVQDGSRAMICARLCDVRPDGRSTLISYGLLNLTHRDGHSREDVKPLVPGEVISITMKLHSTGYGVPEGHCLRLSVSPSYWPVAWPSAHGSSLCIHTGQSSTYLRLPLLTNGGTPPSAEVAERLICSSPAGCPEKAVECLNLGSSSMVASKEWETGIIMKKVMKYSGRQKFMDTGEILEDRDMTTFTIDPEYPLSAKVAIERGIAFEYQEKTDKLGQQEALSAKIEATSEMISDLNYFFLKHHAKVALNGDCIFDKSWDEKILREYV